MTTTTIPAYVAQRSQAGFDPWRRGREKSEELRAMAAQVDEEARENWESPEWRRQVAADLVETIDYGFESETLFSGYIDTETVGEFDRPVERERRGLKVYSTALGGYIKESVMTEEVWEFPRDQMGFHVSEMTDKLRANFSTTIADLSDKGSMRMDAEANRRLITLAQTAIPSTSPFYSTGAGLAKADLDDMIREAQDAIKPDGRGPVPVTILGRSSMVDQITEFAGYSNQPIYGDTALEEIRQRGWLGTYKACTVIRLRNFADEDGVSYLAPNELWVLGGRAGKFVFYGSSQIKFWDENTVDYTHLRARRSTGGLIWHPEQMRRYQDSSLSGS